MKTEEAMIQVTNELKTDPVYRIGWQSNIAMAFCDAADPVYRIGWQSNIAMAFCDAAARYKKRSGKVYLSAVDIHKVANEAANDFITQLCK